jgi:hypothetical protein
MTSSTVQTDVSAMAAGCDMDEGEMDCCSGGHEMACCSLPQPRQSSDLAGTVGISETTFADFALVFPSAATLPVQDIANRAALNIASAAESERLSTPSNRLYIVNRQLLI